MAKLPNLPRRNSGGKTIPPLFDCKPFKVTGLTKNGKPFEPKYGDPGSRITWDTGAGEVWSLAPGGVWVIADGEPYGTVVLVSLKLSTELRRVKH